MKINTNMAAIQTLNSLGKANNSAAKAMERLSSGLRINSAADDAAGMAIANKMNAQVKGLDQANRNAMDGISMIQTAEGSLDEVHSMLQRVRELTVQGANGNYSKEDKATIMNEVDQLIEEMEAIQGRSQFNTMNLLDGTYDNFTLQVGANKDQSMVVNGDGMNLASVLVNVAGISSDTVTELSTKNFTITDKSKVVVDGKEVDLKNAGVTLKPGSVVSVELGSAETFTVNKGGVSTSVTVKAGEKLIFKIPEDSTGGSLTQRNTITNESTLSWTGNKVVMTTAKSGSLGSVSERLFNFDTTTDSDDALNKIDAAIAQTSLIRARLGAYQNRLEHTVTNLDTSEENMTASMSRIEDADMAEEMTNYTQYNVISQAATSMLAQANQRPQQVLQLLNS